MSLLIRYKGIEEERFQDAPFIGALILSIGCSHNCPGCFNQYLRSRPFQTATAEDIIREVKDNPLHQGIILGGLEWTEQQNEMNDLIIEAQKNGLEVMLYTHHTKSWMLRNIPRVFGSGIYVKFGEYKEGEESHQSNGVWLASNNQYIEKLD